ncbi:purine-nucleoside phosphorylase [Silvimonas iriomotensis]|nr:purine nucleoside permease [Silvimonas iriomotensis]
MPGFASTPFVPALLSAAIALSAAAPALAAKTRTPKTHGQPVKVMIISMFGPEAQVWHDHLRFDRKTAIPGFSPDYPAVACTSDGICQMTTGMGHTNAAASVSALVWSRQFDLSKTYFLIAGIAGIDPQQGTVGSAAWARYLVDFGIQWELDAREAPAEWQGGYLGINTKSPSEKPPLDYRTEVFQLNETLLQRAVALSKGVELADSKEAAAFRARYTYAPANQPPSVIQCDTLAGDTWFSGTRLGQRARDFTKIMTDGKGTYCTTQQEDNATYEALKRGAAAGLVDLNRIADLRTGSDFDRPPEGMSDVDNLLKYQEQGGFVPAVQNLYRAGYPLVHAIASDWPHWKDGVPAQ